VNLSGWNPVKAKNLFAGHTVYSIVLEVPDKDLLPKARGGKIGMWALATLATDAGQWHPINRVGQTTRRTSCSRSRPTFQFISELAKSQVPRSRRRHFRTSLLLPKE
jgi:hypothetical protein